MQGLSSGGFAGRQILLQAPELRQTCQQQPAQHVAGHGLARADGQGVVGEQCGKRMPKDFPQHFTGRCIHLPELLGAVNEELTAFLLRRQYRRQLEETRKSARGQYAQMSDLLSATAAGLGEARMSGSGKSFAVKREIENTILETERDEVFVMDVTGEYSYLVRRNHGTEFEFGPDAETWSNPFDMLVQLVRVSEKVDGSATMPAVKEVVELAVFFVIFSWLINNSGEICEAVFDDLTKFNSYIGGGEALSGVALNSVGDNAITDFAAIGPLVITALLVFLFAIVAQVFSQLMPMRREAPRRGGEGDRKNTGRRRAAPHARRERRGYEVPGESERAEKAGRRQDRRGHAAAIIRLVKEDGVDSRRRAA